MKPRKCSICTNTSLDYIFTANNYDIYQCTKCTVARVLPLPSAKQLQTYYRNFDYKTGFITEKLIRKEAREFFWKITIPKGELLDIGCGAGFYLDEARKLGWKVIGIEPSKQLVDYAKKKLKIPVILGDITEISILPKKFDLIILSQVIEHLTDPKQLLQKGYRYLKANGFLYVGTPNIDSILYKVQQEDFSYMIPPEHVYFYSPQSLSVLLEQNGFKIKKLITYGYPQDLSGVIKRLIKGRQRSTKNISTDLKEYPNDPIKFIKYILFDKIFCKSFYRILNINNRGSMISVFAQKA